MPLAVSGDAFWAFPDGPPSRWFGSTDLLVRIDADTWAWAASRTADGIRRLKDAIPGDWLP